MKRRAPLQRSALKRKPTTKTRGRRAGRARPRASSGWLERVLAAHGFRCVVCRGRATQGHHAIEQSVLCREIDRDRVDVVEVLDDVRNGVPVCTRCHERHHTWTRRIQRAELPGSVHEFARDLELEVFYDRGYPG